jgi:hypothetical protein
LLRIPGSTHALSTTRISAGSAQPADRLGLSAGYELLYRLGSGDGQTRAAHDLCSGIPSEPKRHFVAEKCGHYGIFSGRRWRAIIYSQLRDFILEHSNGKL